MDAAYWTSLADDYVAAYQQAFGRPAPSKSPLILSMSCAEHETNNGRAWPGTNNFGACQLRGLTPDENTAFHAGTLKAGDYTPSRDGVLHVDTHPTPSGPAPYPVWFAAFPTRVAGIAFFLKTLYRLSSNAPDADGATCATVAEAMYRHGYYEGAHAGCRPVALRVGPLTPPEQANVGDYARAMNLCLTSIMTYLSSWDVPTPPPAPGQEAGEAGANEASPS